jgi:hypothetical protein
MGQYKFLNELLNNIKDTPIFYSIIKLNIDTKINKYSVKFQLSIA